MAWWTHSITEQNGRGPQETVVVHLDGHGSRFSKSIERGRVISLR